MLEAEDNFYRLGDADGGCDSCMTTEVEECRNWKKFTYLY